MPGDDPNGIGEVAGLTFAIMMVAIFIVPEVYKTPDPQKKAELRKQVINALKSPVMADRMIEELKKPEMQALLSDPEVMKDMDKAKQTILAKIEELKTKKVVLDELAPKDSATWAKKAVEKAQKASDERKTAERN